MNTTIRNSSGKGETPVECLSDDLIFRYTEGTASAAEAEDVQDHLDSCETCLAVVAAAARTLAQPPSKTELVEFEKAVTLNPEKQLAKIMAIAKESRSITSQSKEESKATRREFDFSPRPDVWQSLRRFLDWPIPKPRYAFAVAVVAVAIVGGLLIYRDFFKNDPYEYYTYDDKVPYDYDVSSLRTPTTSDGDSLLYSFVTQFKLGMSDYMINNYENAIQSLQEIEPAALALQAKPEDQKYLSTMRDYYFYLGVSHFALSRSKRKNVSAEAKAMHATQAIRWLARGDSLVAKNHLQGNERENYFLGLAYGFSGRRTEAIESLRKINDRSKFHDSGNQFIKEWSKQ